MGCITSSIDEKSDLNDKTKDNTSSFSLVGNSSYVKVVEVYDGDTITIVFRFGNKFYHKRCRIYGVDTPELRTKDQKEKEAAIKARDYVKQLLLGKVIWAAFEKEDKYGRLLAVLWFDKNDSESIDKKIIRAGFGYEYKGGTKKEFQTNILTYM